MNGKCIQQFKDEALVTDQLFRAVRIKTNSVPNPRISRSICQFRITWAEVKQTVTSEIEMDIKSKWKFGYVGSMFMSKNGSFRS